MIKMIMMKTMMTTMIMTIMMIMLDTKVTIMESLMLTYG